MVKKKIEHGPLYEHARKELERAGVSSGKGNLDQKVYHTTLKLIDIYEKAADTQLLENTIGNLFATLSQGEIINPPTDEVDEWQLRPTLLARDGSGAGHTSVLRRCPAFRSDDAGVTWYRPDTGADGISIEVEGELDNANEKSPETIQPAKSE